MNNMANMANMGAVGGPVGAPMPMMNNNGAIPHPGGQRQPQLNDAHRTLLNTYIYEYFMRYGMYDCARTIYQQDPEINVKKDGDRRDENGNPLGNGLGDDSMDTDSKDLMDQKRPDDLPAPNLPGSMTGSCFLYEWFCLFWDMFNSQKGKGSTAQINQYVSHTQQQSRFRQEQQQNMLRNIRPPEYPQQYQQHLIGRVPNGGMNVKLSQGNLQRAAMANNQNPQAMHMLQQQKREQQDMGGDRVRPASPGTTDNAPSPSKRPRLDGTPFNPAQGMVLPNGQRQGMPGQQQHHGNQMSNKPMAGAGGPQAQGSPMLPQGPDGAAIGQFYPGDIAPGTTMRAGHGAQATGSNHALQDYQMQLMLLEQQNKKRLMMARQEQDISGNNMRGAEGPGGPGGPGAPPGAGGQGFQGTSPPGGRNGASPNPTEQMKRASQQMGNAAANMGSPLPDGAQNRSSPNGGINFMGANMDPNGTPHFGMNMLPGAQMNGGMRPPSSHPQTFNGQMTPQQQQQMLAAQRQAAQQGAQGGPGMQWAQGGPNGQMAGQGPQAPVQGTPQQRAMLPPSAPAGGPAGAANSRNTTSSPQTTTAAPPTPQQGNKAAPKKKGDTKAKAKAASQKKTGAGVNAGATPAADGDAPQEPPTPATPITPVNPASFAKNQNVNAAQGVPAGQPAAAPQPPVPAVPAAPLPDQNRAAANFMEPAAIDFSMDFANPLTSDNVLTDFDFDSFLQDNNGADDGGFDFATGFMEGGEIGAE